MREELMTFLLSARDADLAYQDTKELVAQLDLQCKKITPSMSDMPGGGGDDHGRERAYVALLDAKELLVRRLERTVRAQVEVGDFIDRVPGRPVHRAILRRRYVHCEPWRDVEKWLKKHGEWYEERQIYNLHGEALQSARQLWAIEHEEMDNEDSSSGLENEQAMEDS